MIDGPRTVFVTKHALTDGIRQMEAERLSPHTDGLVYVREPGSPSYGLPLGPLDWHVTREAAEARADAMRDMIRTPVVPGAAERG